MANSIYPLYKQALMSAGTDTSLIVNTTQDGPYCSLVDTGTYTYSTAHQFMSPSLTGIVGTDQRIASPTVSTAGTFDGNDITYTAVSGATVEALVIYRHNATANTTWKLVVYLDTGVTGLPVTQMEGTFPLRGMLLEYSRFKLYYLLDIWELEEELQMLLKEIRK